MCIMDIRAAMSGILMESLPRKMERLSTEGMLDTISIEKDYVLQIYDEIADHFSITRSKPWPKVQKFIEALPIGSSMLDVGCGNGKYMGQKNLRQIGVDTSEKLLDICRDRGYDVMQSNCLSIPFKNSSMDAIICIAVIHHLASEARRKQSIQEMVRVLRIGGEALIYVWAMEQRRNKKFSTYLRQKRSNRHLESQGGVAASTETAMLPNGLAVHENRTEFVQQDMLVPWKLKNTQSTEENSETVKVFHRFYHVFKEGELEDLCNSVPGLEIVESYYDEGNWCIRFRKT